jgi:hypothetical protein
MVGPWISNVTHLEELSWPIALLRANTRRSKVRP